MKSHHTLETRIIPWALVLIVVPYLPAADARAEEWIDWGREPVLPRDLFLGPTGAGFTNPSRSNRIPLFRIQPGYISDTGGLDPDDSTPEDRMSPRKDNDGPNWVQLAMGNDNPYFDLRRPGDPGGVGFYRVTTQVQLFDNERSGCAVALRAVTPAGLEMDGLSNGATVFRPAFSLFHFLDDGTGIQGFVGRHVHINPGPGPQYRGMEYGMALHRPLPVAPNGMGNLFVFVETLGRYRYEPDTGARTDAGGRSPNLLEVLPGLHWRCNDSMWISGGLIFPVNNTPIDPRLWQITCSFRF